MGLAAASLVMHGMTSLHRLPRLVIAKANVSQAIDHSSDEQKLPGPASLLAHANSSK
jgi:hypothetical protein